MDTAWIQVFVLTIAECVAPAGKTVFQQQEFDLQFLTRADCEVALEQFITLKDASANVIVDKTRSSCIATARKSIVFADPGAIKAATGAEAWKEPEESSMEPPQSLVSHQDRLEALPDCTEYDGGGACKMGGIIIEAANQGASVEVWRKDP